MSGYQSRPTIHVGHSIVPGAPDSGTILHVPHSSSMIPQDIRQHIGLDDEGLARELALMTDAHTDIIADQAASAASSRAWMFVNQLSRLVIDPERFPDERETMRRVGMGAVYTRTAAGEPLRADVPSVERQLVDEWYDPYANAMTDLVEERLARVGRVTIIDVHSYPSQRLPYELGGEQRPSVCLGTDPYHTPQWLLSRAREIFSACGDVAENTPFAGCYVPLRHFEKDRRVSALMVEIRRDIYMVEPGGPPTNGITTVSRSLTALIDAVEQE